MIQKLLLMAAVLIGTAGGVVASDSEISYPEYSIEARDGALVIRDYEKKPLLKIGRQLFSWRPPVATPVDAEKVGHGRLTVDHPPGGGV